MLLGVFSVRKNNWEELYDYETNTYFYRNRSTGEYSRNNPEIVEIDSEHVPKKCTDPLWETLIDPETLEPYYTDMETGKICYIRPEIGTFVTEFKRNARIQSKQSRASSRKSIKSTSTVSTNKSRQKSMRVVKRDDDFGIVSGNGGDMDFSTMFGENTSPAQFDAGARFASGSTSKPVANSVTTARLSTKEGIDDSTPEEDEQDILESSTVATDNPLFQWNRT